MSRRVNGKWIVGVRCTRRYCFVITPFYYRRIIKPPDYRQKITQSSLSLSPNVKRGRNNPRLASGWKITFCTLTNVGNGREQQDRLHNREITENGDGDTEKRDEKEQTRVHQVVSCCICPPGFLSIGMYDMAAKLVAHSDDRRIFLHVLRDPLNSFVFNFFRGKRAYASWRFVQIHTCSRAVSMLGDFSSRQSR